jgi:hypothetical protein
MSRTHDVTISAFDLDRIESELAAVTEQRDRLAKEVENLKVSGIHSCHDQCKRPMCVMRRQRDRLAEALRELCETLLKDKPRDITELLNKAGDALAAVKGKDS